MTKPKVLQLCLSDGLGGLELYVFRTVQQLRQRNHPCVAVVRGETMLSSRMDDEGIAYYSLKKGSRLLPLVTAHRLAEIIDREQVDIIHMHWAKDMMLAVLAKRLCRRDVRLVYTRQMMITRPKHDSYHRWVYRHVDRVITITDELCELMHDYLPIPAERIERLYYGVDAAPALSALQRAQIRRDHGFAEDDFVVFMVGRIEPYKGQHLLLDAMETLQCEGVAVKALFVGPAMDEGYLQGMKQRVQNSALKGAVTFAGPHRQPSHLAAAFDVALLATECETFGLVLIEAMRAGVCVVGTAACGVLEIIDDGETGLLFPPNDAQALAGVIRRLYEDAELRATIAAAGRRKADELFATTRHYDRLEGLFSRLMQGGPAG